MFFHRGNVLLERFRYLKRYVVTCVIDSFRDRFFLVLPVRRELNGIQLRCSSLPFIEHLVVTEDEALILSRPALLPTVLDDCFLRRKIMIAEFNCKQVARICKVAPRTVVKWVDKDRIKGCIYRHGLRVIPRQSLVNFLNEWGISDHILVEMEKEDADSRRFSS